MVDKPKIGHTQPKHATFFFVSLLMFAGAWGYGLDTDRAVIWLPFGILTVLAAFMWAVCIFNLVMRKDEP